MQSVSYYRVQALCSLMQALFVICLLFCVVFEAVSVAIGHFANLGR